ncbi:hypothetical protein TruAng_002019 [Truncatella angustata]|nr:hypothetical protein TruAng_002019 [Truncatella angustata]
MSSNPPPPTSNQVQSAPADAPADAPATESTTARRESVSQRSENSQTAADFIRDQMQLEADAREALPYCHGEHELVEIFQKRNFTCDCGTTRFTSDQPCTLRINSETNTKGGVHSEPADPNNKYNHNFRNRFCSCAIDYNPHEQKGTMFQCLGLGTHEDGGCGEDWYHPGCLMGLGPKWYESSKGNSKSNRNGDGSLPTITEDGLPPDNAAVADGEDEEEEDDAPLPDGFPSEDDFDHFICYKCVDANPWIKRYAGVPGFLPAVFFNKGDGASSPKKRQRDDEDNVGDEANEAKRLKSEQTEQAPLVSSTPQDNTPGAEVAGNLKEESKIEPEEELTREIACKLDSLPSASPGQFSLFVRDNFRDQFCRCSKCFPKLLPHPQLLEEEEAYEPPLTDEASEHASTHASGSIYERGESALRNVDRVRAIEGVMAYNHMKEKLKPFFEQFAGSGKAISAEDVKEYFAKLRGDQEAIQEAGEAAKADNRHEQSGY